MTSSSDLRVLALVGSITPSEGWFGPDEAYVEAVWLPIVGPASYLIWCRLARELLRCDGGFTTRLEELSAAVGLGSPDGEQAAISRTLRRLQHFGLAWRPVEAQLVVRCSLPPASSAQLDRLHPTVQQRHRKLCRSR
jgi:hypothetical protein